MRCCAGALSEQAALSLHVCARCKDAGADVSEFQSLCRVFAESSSKGHAKSLRRSCTALDSTKVSTKPAEELKTARSPG